MRSSGRDETGTEEILFFNEIPGAGSRCDPSSAPVSGGLPPHTPGVATVPHQDDLMPSPEEFTVKCS